MNRPLSPDRYSAYAELLYGSAWVSMRKDYMGHYVEFEDYAKLVAYANYLEQKQGDIRWTNLNLKKAYDKMKKTGWQSIDTAPKDGNSVVVYFENALHTSWAQVAHWSEKEQSWCEWHHDAEIPILGLNITHWMPYPEKPTNE